MEVEVARRTGVQLFPHQVQAIQWMQRTEKRPRMVPDQPHGGILAHAMGLGKTITTLCTLLLEGVGTTIIVCPKSVMMQWRDEAVRILGIPCENIVLFHGGDRECCFPLQKPCLVLTTFDIVRLSVNQSHSLHSQQWDRIVLDEAHRICEQSSKTAKAIRMLRARNRWAVTGTPFKNGVSDLVALSKFLLVPPYCSSTWWRCNSHNQHKILEWRNMFVNIQQKDVLALPPVLYRKHVVTLSPVEADITSKIASMYSRQNMPAAVPKRKFHELNDASDETLFLKKKKGGQEFELLKIMRLRQSANHPLSTAQQLLYLPVVPRDLGSETCNACNVKTSEGGKCAVHKLCAECSVDLCPCCIAEKMVPSRNAEGGVWRHSSKTRAFAEYLTDTLQGDPGAKIVLFSQWTTCLDMLGHLLDFLKVGFARYDGRVNNLDDRADVLHEFERNPGCNVLLTSLGAGGEGLNLTFATYIVLFEPYWNSAAEQQAIDRAHRIGQTRTTVVVRFHVDNSIEKWVIGIQQTKMVEAMRLLSQESHTPPEKTMLSKNRFRLNVVCTTNNNSTLSKFVVPTK